MRAKKSTVHVRPRRRNPNVSRASDPRLIKPRGKRAHPNPGRNRCFPDKDEWTCFHTMPDGTTCGYHQDYRFATCPRCHGKQANMVRLIRQPSQVKTIVMNLARLGLSQRKIAELVNVSEDTFTREKQKDKSFAEALDLGRVRSIAFSLTKLKENVRDNVERAIEFDLANSLGWGTERGMEGEGAPTTVKFLVDPSKIVRAAAEHKQTAKPKAKDAEAEE